MPSAGLELSLREALPEGCGCARGGQGRPGTAAGQREEVRARAVYWARARPSRGSGVGDSVMSMDADANGGSLWEAAEVEIPRGARDPSGAGVEICEPSSCPAGGWGGSRHETRSSGVRGGRSEEWATAEPRVDVGEGAPRSVQKGGGW